MKKSQAKFFRNERKGSLALWVMLLVVSTYACKQISMESVPKARFATATTVNVKDFGAVGDGITDDYEALLSVTDYVDSIGSATVIFPEGVYYIAPYHTASNNLRNIQFTDCDGLEVLGDNAKIVVNGDFHRDFDYTVGSHRFSHTSAIMPMIFVSCNDVFVSGLEIQGGVAQTTRDTLVAETGGHLLRFVACSNVEVSDVYVHHAQTDGIVFTGNPTTPSTNIYVHNTISENNARQGITITNAIGANFVDCEFKYSGYTGTYGSHAPAASIDIEPMYLSGGLKTNDINFRRCTFAHSKGSQFTCSQPNYTNRVRLIDCTIDASGSQSTYSMILTASDILIDSCDIDAGNGNVYPRWDVLYGSKTEIKNSTIKGKRSGLLAITASTLDTINIHHNTILFDTTATVPTYFPYLRAPGLSFNHNEVFMPSSALKTGPESVIQNGVEATYNIFYTENPSLHPQVSYTGMAIVNNNLP